MLGWSSEESSDKLNEKDGIQELEDVNRVIADTEIAEINRETVNNNVIDMNRVNLTYNALLENEEEINYKKYIKSLLQSNVTNVLFWRPPCKRKLENIQWQALQKIGWWPLLESWRFCCNFWSGKILRRDIMNLRQWKFNGSFHGFKIPKSLSTLLEWVLVGPSPSFTNESVNKNYN